MRIRFTRSFIDCAPRHPKSFWDLAGLEDSIGDTAEGGADVEGNHEGLPVAGVGLS